MNEPNVQQPLVPHPKQLRELISHDTAHFSWYFAPSAFWITAALRVTYYLGFAAAETAETVALETVARTTFAMAGAALFCFAAFLFIQAKWYQKNSGDNLEIMRGISLYSLNPLLGIVGAAIAYTGASHLPFDAATSTAKEATRIVMTAVAASIFSAPLLTLIYKLAASKFSSLGAVFLKVFIVGAFAAAATTAMFDLMPNFIAMIAESATLNTTGQTALKIVTYGAQPVIEGLASAAAGYAGSVFCSIGSYALGKISETSSCCHRQHEPVAP